MSRPELRLESVQATGQVTVGRRGRGLRTVGGVCPAAGYARLRGVGGGKDCGSRRGWVSGASRVSRRGKRKRRAATLQGDRKIMSGAGSRNSASDSAALKSPVARRCWRRTPESCQHVGGPRRERGPRTGEDLGDRAQTGVLEVGAGASPAPAHAVGAHTCTHAHAGSEC